MRVQSNLRASPPHRNDPPPNPVLTLVLALRVSRLVRFTAYAVLLCLGFLSAETVVADVCDGDGGARTAHVESGTHQRAISAERHGPSDGDDAGAPEGHAFHIDHCSHPHGGGVVATLSAAAPEVPPSGSIRAESERRPPSTTAEPLIRPPVA